MTKEQVKLKAEEIVNKLSVSEYATVDFNQEKFVLKTMLKFGVYIEELTKQRCLENAKSKIDEVYLEEDEDEIDLLADYDDYKIADTESNELRYMCCYIDSNSILNIPNLCTNE